MSLPVIGRIPLDDNRNPVLGGVSNADGETAVAVYIEPNSHSATVTLGTALSQAIDSILTYPRGSNSTRLAASGLVLTGAGKFNGFFVETASATPTLQVYDNTAASGTILVGTFTPVAGTLYPFPSLRVGTGIYVVMSGTVSCVVIYDPITT